MDDSVEFVMSGATSGWVGIGFSLDDKMPQSDVVVASATKSKNEYVLSDRYAYGHSSPIEDITQSSELLSLQHVSGYTIVSFRRPVNTGDLQDIDLREARYLLWAVGPHWIPADGGLFTKHFHCGVVPMNISEQNHYPPRPSAATHSPNPYPGIATPSNPSHSPNPVVFTDSPFTLPTEYDSNELSTAEQIVLGLLTIAAAVGAVWIFFTVRRHLREKFYMLAESEHDDSDDGEE